MGVPLCPNKKDLNWCWNATSWEAPEDWTPMRGSDANIKVKCAWDESDGHPHGQWIEATEKADGLDYHCLNRQDEDPFLKKANTSETGKKSWLENFETACPNEQRRCLGNRADKCICKYNISRKKAGLLFFLFFKPFR